MTDSVQNIFIVSSSPWWVKIGDFGISKRIEAELTELRTQVGTLNYQAPEVVGCGIDEEDDYTMAVDLWSLGCVVYKILTKSVPFTDIRALRRFVVPKVISRSGLLPK
jgi:serine/threonine protein kinase